MGDPNLRTDANGVRITPARTVVVCDQPGHPLCLSLGDGMGGRVLHELSDARAMVIAEQLIAAVRGRVSEGRR